ncbi:MAG: tripartite tricarboxylate transporter TctB family protein [Candidatus Methylomirabilales bacterium]
MSTKTADIIVATILLGIGLVVGFDAWRLGSGWGMEGPQAGFFPFVMAVLVILGSGLAIRQAIQGTSSVKGSKRFVPPGALKPVLTVLIPAALMIVLTEFVGLYVAAMIYLTGYIRIVGGYAWRTVLLVSILVPVAFYISFEKLFLIPMPQGWWGATLLPF